MTVGPRPTRIITTYAVRFGGPDAGAPCEATGDGFLRRDPCEHSCIDWDVTCEDGSTVVAGPCSAGGCRSDGDGPSGFTWERSGSVTSSCLQEDTCPS